MGETTQLTVTDKRLVLPRASRVSHLVYPPTNDFKTAVPEVDAASAEAKRYPHGKRIDLREVNEVEKEEKKSRYSSR